MQGHGWLVGKCCSAIGRIWLVFYAGSSVAIEAGRLLRARRIQEFARDGRKSRSATVAVALCRGAGYIPYNVLRNSSVTDRVPCSSYFERSCHHENISV